MKRFVIELCVVLLIFGFTSAVKAEETASTDSSLEDIQKILSTIHFSAVYRVRGYDINNIRDFNDDRSDDEQYFDQRLRIWVKYEPVKNYSINFRTDVSEGVYGYNYNDDGEANRPSEDIEWQFDQLYFRADKEQYTLDLGLQMIAFAHTWVFLPRVTGATINLKMIEPVNLTLHYGKRDDNDKLTPIQLPDYGDRGGDEDLYGAQLMYKHNKSWYCLYFAELNDADGDGAGDDTIVRRGFGVGIHSILGPVVVDAEGTYFGGSNENTDTDYMGTQLVLDAKYQMKELSFGARLYYAQAADDDEAQLTSIQLADPNPSFFFGMGKDYERDIPEIIGVMSNTASSPASFLKSIFDPTSQGAGVVGGTLYGDYNVFEKLKVTAAITSLTPEDTDKTDLDGGDVDLEKLMILNFGAKYQATKNISISGGLSYWMPETDSGENEDNALVVSTQFNFRF